MYPTFAQYPPSSSRSNTSSKSNSESPTQLAGEAVPVPLPVTGSGVGAGPAADIGANVSAATANAATAAAVTSSSATAASSSSTATAPTDVVAGLGSGGGGDVPLRPTRKQVSRACDWCRARRIKCDNGRPCRACRQRGAECTHKGTDEPRTLPQAMREVEKLRARVRQLENELKASKIRERQALQAQSIPTPNNSDTCAQTSPTSTRDQGIAIRKTSSLSPAPVSPLESPKPQWEGVYVATSGSDQTSYYGPVSHFSYMGRVGAYLNKALQQPCLPKSMQPKEARLNAAVTNPNYLEEKGNPLKSGNGGGGGSSPRMNRTQEEYFLSLYWESYYCFSPIVDEAEFRRHYASLWEPGKTQRKPSPLVDIILALCLQFGYSFIPRDDNDPQKNNPDDDATMAGRWYYRRCQSLLTADLESPTVTTVQCLIYSAHYLCCASFQNMCHVTLAQAVRTAQILGLHLEPPADLPIGARELRKRIWWVLWLTEAKTSCKLGRPTCTDRSQMTVTEASDSLEAATANGATLGGYGDVTWLTYHVHVQRLMSLSCDVHSSLLAKFGEAIHSSDYGSAYRDPQVLESCAEHLATQMPRMRAWVDQLPTGIKTQRRNGGEAMSVDRNLLDIDLLAPTWLLRERLGLEIMYHTQMLNLLRPFVAFYSNSSTYTPITERHAAACVNHSMALVQVMHQAVTETDLMSGWSEFFFLTWNGIVTAAGFLLAYPIHPATTQARKSLEKGAIVFDIFGANFAVAEDAAKIVRNLLASADTLAGRLRSGVATGNGQENEPNNITAATIANAGPQIGERGADVIKDLGGDDGLAWLDPSQQDDPNYYSEFMDWALSVDQFNSFERFFNANNPADPWQFGQQGV